VYKPDKDASQVTDFREITDQKKKETSDFLTFQTKGTNPNKLVRIGNTEAVGVDTERKAQNRNAVGTLQPLVVRGKRKGEEVWAF
jgi:hypothetical protein